MKITLITFVIAAIGFSSCKQNQEAAVTTAPGAINVDTLDYQTALRYVKNYEKHAGTVDSLYIDAKGDTIRKKLPNTRAIWLSKARIHALDSIVNKEGGDGLRFYFATYDTTNNPKPALRAHKPGYNTLVIAATKDSLGKDGKVYHRDFYKKKRGDQNGATQGFIIGNPPENRGEQCPPPATCSSIGATLVN